MVLCRAQSHKRTSSRSYTTSSLLTPGRSSQAWHLYKCVYVTVLKIPISPFKSHCLCKRWLAEHKGIYQMAFMLICRFMKDCSYLCLLILFSGAAMRVTCTAWWYKKCLHYTMYPAPTTTRPSKSLVLGQLSPQSLLKRSYSSVQKVRMQAVVMYTVDFFLSANLLGTFHYRKYSPWKAYATIQTVWLHRWSFDLTAQQVNSSDVST